MPLEIRAIKRPVSEVPVETKQATPEVEAKKKSRSAKHPVSEAPVETKQATPVMPEVEAQKKSESTAKSQNKDKSGSKKKTQPVVESVESKDGKPEKKAPHPFKPAVIDGSDFQYQAIGSVNGVLLEEDGRYLIEIQGQKLSLFCFKKARHQAEKLVGQEVWVRCYPQFANKQLSFSAKSINLDNLQEYIANEFVLRGVWQYTPKSSQPVFTIYRNDLQRGSKVFNQHLPLIWHDEEPFRFQEGETGNKPKFYQIKARLLPSKGCFEFASQIAEPMNRLPRRVRQKYSQGQNQQK